MKRIIINCHADISDEDAMRYVRAVVNEGKVSDDGKSYCHITVFGTKPDRIAVRAVRRAEGKHTFTIVEDKQLTPAPAGKE